MDVDVKQGVNLSSHYKDDHFKWRTIHTVSKDDLLNRIYFASSAMGVKDSEHSTMLVHCIVKELRGLKKEKHHKSAQLKGKQSEYLQAFKFKG